MEEQKEELQRGLKNRHIQLIAIGGAIGTGLFLGAGKSIHLAGPSIMLVYLIIGAILFFVMRALGELLIHNPTTGSLQNSQSNLLDHGLALLLVGHIGSAGL